KPAMNMFIQLSDWQAAILWNGAIALALLLMLFVQWKEIKRTGLDALSTFVAIAIFNTALLIGARLGAMDGAAWQTWWQGQAMSHNTGKSIFGGLLLALPVYWL